MGIRELIRALGRRWDVVLVGILVTVTAGWYVWNTNPPDYSARSLVLLLPPTGTAEEADGSNPFLQLGGLELTARVLVATYSSSAFSEEIEARSPDAEVEVSVDDSTRGGVILVDVKDTDEQSSLELLDYVTGDVSDRLADLQAQLGVESSAAVRSMLLTTDTQGEPDYQSLIRVFVVAVGGLLAATIAMALLVDTLIGLHHRRRSRARILTSESERAFPIVSSTPETGADPDGILGFSEAAGTGAPESSAGGSRTSSEPRSARRVYPRK